MTISTSTPYQTSVSSKQKERIGQIVDECSLSKHSDEVAVGVSIFGLARKVKTLFGFEPQLPPECKTLFKRWHRNSESHIDHESFDVLWASFIYAWDLVKTPTDIEVFDSLVQLSKSMPYPPICSEYEDVGRELIRLCAVLDLYWADEPFYISCRKAAELYGYSHTAMSLVLKSLVRKGILKEVLKGSAATGRATRYIFLADKGVEMPEAINWSDVLDKGVEQCHGY